MPPKRNKKGQYEIQFSQGGRRIHRVLPKGISYQQAREKETKLRSEVFNADELGRVPDYTIGEGIMRYLSEYQGKAKRQTENHAKALQAYVSGRGMDDMSEVAGAVRNGASGSRSTKNRRLSILRRVAALAYSRWGWLEKPIKIEMLPENPARQVYLNRDELANLLWRIKNKKYRRACYCAAFTGLRQGELLGLEPDDIRGDVICLTNTKSGNPRNVPIIRRARFAFRRLPFKLDRSALSGAVRSASGGKVRFHDLRHTTASLLINAGVPLYVVGQILGHKSLQTTKRYAHLEVKTMASEMEKLHRNSPQIEPHKKRAASA